MLDRVNLHIALGERRGAVRFGDIFHARLDFRFAVEVHAAEAHAAVGGRGQDGHVHPVAAVKADAGKRRGTIERLLVEHAQIRQNAGAVGKRQIAGQTGQTMSAASTRMVSSIVVSPVMAR